MSNNLEDLKDAIENAYSEFGFMAEDFEALETENKELKLENDGLVEDNIRLVTDVDSLKCEIEKAMTYIHKLENG